MNTLSEFKRGDTFILVCTYKVDDVSAPIAGKTIVSQIRDSAGNLIADMDFDADEANPARFRLTPDTDTADWPLGVLLCDVQITGDDIVTSSETIEIPVVKDITR